MTYSSVQNGRGRGQRRGEPRRPGQWKLAYADFLTALMAFFLLMWLSTDSSAAERAAIAAYFSGNDASVTANGALPPVLDLHANIATQIDEHAVLTGLTKHIQLVDEQSALRIELTDLQTGSLFEPGRAALNTTGEALLSSLAALLAPMPVSLRVEGHTDAFKTAPTARDNWDISASRASNARRLLQNAGIDPAQFKSVTGLAATQPLLVNQPHAAVNRRISIVLELSH